MVELADLKRAKIFKIVGIASLGAFLLYFLISSPRGVIFLVGICLLLIGLLFILKPYYFLLIYMAVMPFTYLLGTTEKMSPIRFIGPLLIVCALPAILLNTKSLKVKISPLGISVILFIFACFLSIFSLVSPENAIFGFLLFLGNGLFYGIVVALVDSMKKVKTIIWVMCGTFGLSALWGLTQRFLYGTEVYRIYGVVGDPNYFALLLAPIAFIVFYQFWASNKIWVKIFFLFLFISLTLTILLTVSRGIIITFSIVLLWLFIRRKKWTQLLLTLATILLVVNFFTPKMFKEGLKWSELTGRLRMYSVRLRTNFAISSLKIFVDYPLLGVGPDNFKVAYLDYREENKVPAIIRYPGIHNTFLEILVGTGLLGFVPFLAIILFSLKNYHNIRKKLKENKEYKTLMLIEGIESGFMAFLLGSLSLSWQHSILLWFFVALSSALNKLAKNLRSCDKEVL